MSVRTYECKFRVTLGDDEDQFKTPTLDNLADWLADTVVLDFDDDANPYGVSALRLDWATLRDVTDDPSCKELPFDVKLDNHADS